ncbi:hypothetical protein ACWCXB_03720 [Streptomyces sp. NPDC001514]
MMKFIKAEWSPEWRGFRTDPRGYLAELPNFADDLPNGARTFALDPDHYDYGSQKCVKDLKLIGVSLAAGGGRDFEIRFGPNEFKHVSGLVMRYAQVSELSLAVDEAGSSVDDLGTVLLDEILPVRGGCSHEIALTGGVISISCADLDADWQ